MLQNGKQVNLAPGAQPASWAEIVYDALMFPSERIQKMANLADKRKMYSIASRVMQFPKNVSVQPDELEMIFACVGDKNIPAVIGAFDTYLAPPKPVAVHEEQAGER
jgi:hypothetical protein